MKNLVKTILALSLVMAGGGLSSGTTSAIAQKNSQIDTPSSERTLQAVCGLPFQDNAILQQKLPVPIWGTTLPGAAVTISFAEQTKKTRADQEGKWRVVLDPMEAVKLKSVNDNPTGKTISITTEKDGKTALKELKNILMGEVWLCAGQSNMAGGLKTIILKEKGPDGKSRMVGGTVKDHKLAYYPADTITSADYPALRQLSSPTAEWVRCSPDTAWQFKKVGYFFARRVQKETLVPVGIIGTAVGGSKIESWLNQKPYETGNHYQRLVTPLVGFGVRGLLWYQGESNSNDKRTYQPKLESLIRGWRSAWNQPDAKDPTGPRAAFSSYFVQLPGIGTSPPEEPAMGDGRAEIRQACFDTIKVPNTGMAIALDIGTVGEHPPNKYDTGVRLAHLALHNDYGMKDLVPSGPLYTSHRIEKDKIRISFDHAESGLMIAEKKAIEVPKALAGAKLGWISIQDKNGTWHWADAEIDGSELVVSCKGVKEPTAVRYAYTNRPIGPLLYNPEGMPASPFTTCGYDKGLVEPEAKGK
jgi:sialate O-acetylesterase